ncbi:MAG: hypothetical protein ACD_77C00294G0005 [uncultured bacterium]|nr:MAG: hypothetical protein ACD_77C00294G0005 [uncultured bacterium]HBY01570.1 hypothetical protein [Rikenellaceae bacterium]
MTKLRFEYRITFAYLFIGGLWILFSDELLESLVEDPYAITTFQSYKGWFYVLVTALMFFVFIKRHIEKLRRAERQAMESDRLKSAFLANVSHEIRTPMNGIMGFTELLKEHDTTLEQQMEYLTIIEQNGERMLDLINDLINISKLDSGQMKLSISEFDINEKMNLLFHFFQMQAEVKGLSLNFKPGMKDMKGTIILSDKDKISSILSNLIKNAIKYTNKGTIEFGYIQKNGELQFYVADTGIGIEQDKQKSIFDRFVQADLSLAKSYEGAGLGLAISKAYTELLGGKIWLESKCGAGSTFYFSVPYKKASGAAG